MPFRENPSLTEMEIQLASDRNLCTLLGRDGPARIRRRDLLVLALTRRGYHENQPCLEPS